MRILFHDDGHLNYTPQTPYVRPLGGTETAVSYLSAALAARGHEVALINKSTERGRVRGVEMLGAQAARQSIINTYDVIVSVTYPNGASLRESGVKIPTVLWQHKTANASTMTAFADPRERSAWSSFVFVSNHQREAFRSQIGMNGEVLKNAASPAVLATPVTETTFVDRGEDPILLYASAPGRGLDLLLMSFSLVKEHLPGLRLRLCTDQGLYQRDSEDDEYVAFYALARAIGGVEFIGALSQVSLASAYAQADILAYPTNFTETSSIVAIEAACAGCMLVMTDLGALPETAMGFGALLPFINSRPKIAKQFAGLLLKQIELVRRDPDRFRQHRLAQVEAFRATHSWPNRAAEWEQSLVRLLSRLHYAN